MTKTRTRTSHATVSCAALLAAFAAISFGQTKPSKKEAPHAVIAGTVFRDPGFAQPGVAVTLIRKDDPKAKKLQDAVSDHRGEFAFRVPPTQATYVVNATLKGFKPAREEVQIGGEEQVNATLVLVPESK